MKIRTFVKVLQCCLLSAIAETFVMSSLHRLVFIQSYNHTLISCPCIIAYYKDQCLLQATSCLGGSGLHAQTEKAGQRWKTFLNVPSIWQGIIMIMSLMMMMRNMAGSAIWQGMIIDQSVPLKHSTLLDLSKVPPTVFS